MKTILPAILAVALPFIAAASEHVETWVISGQSNACGRGALPGADPHANVEMHDGKNWVQATEPLPLGGTVGPWLKAATAIGKTGIKLRLTGSASSGTPIEMWEDQKAAGIYLFSSIQRAGANADVFLWYQGETDGVNGMDGETYQSKLKGLVERVRTAAKNPEMLAVVIQIAHCNLPKGELMPIREAQRRFVIEDKNAILVPAMGRARGDYAHLSKEGYFGLGDEIARALDRTRYKREKDSASWPGPVMDSAVLGADGKTLVAHFAEVRKLGGAQAIDFGVLENGTVVKVDKVEMQATRALLTLERVVKLPAKLVYGVGNAPAATLVDEAGNRAPAVQLELTLGAPPDDKESLAPNGAGGIPAKKPRSPR